MSSLHEHHEEPPSGLPHSRIPVPKPRDDQRCEAVGVAPHRVPSACSAKRLEHLVRGLGVAAAGAHELRAALGGRNRAGAVVSSRSRATAAEEAIAARPPARQAERPHWPPSSRRCRHAHRLPLGRLSDGPAAGAASC